MKEKKKSGTKNFVMAALVMFLGITFSVGIFIYILTGINDNSFKFVAPADQEVSLDEGKYTVYYEYRSEFEGVLYTTNDQDLQGLGLKITDVDTNQPIDIALPSGTSTYSVNGNSAYAIYTFELEKESILEIKAETEDDKKLVLNINDGLAGTIMLGVFILLFGVSLSIVVGLILIILGVSKMSKQRQAKHALEKDRVDKGDITKRNQLLKETNQPLKEINEPIKEINEPIKEIDESVIQMWKAYLEENNLNSSLVYEAWSFGNNESMARELADLVLKGKKQGTASLKKLVDMDGEALPKVGDLNIITDWDGKAKCIIKTKKVMIQAFKDVDENFAKVEGEGDGSLYFWRKAHIEFFTEELKAYNLEFSEDLLVICESFELVYKA